MRNRYANRCDLCVHRQKGGPDVDGNTDCMHPAAAARAAYSQTSRLTARPLLMPVKNTVTTRKGASMTATQTDEATDQVPARRMPLPADPEDALIDEACRDLRLPAFRERFVELSTAARREQATYKQFLLDLLQVEIADRDVRRQ
ncbi:hypothetical protein [Streptomyces yangpuensis]|uniref:hypothetical protein n=1 Tax=Streptomyces yangpuensis TaxID=1648182 RepID=UPI00380ABE12